METSSFQHYLIGLLAIGNNVSALGAFLLHTQGMPRAKVKRLILGDLDRLGYKRVVFRSDNEPALIALLRAVRQSWVAYVLRTWP